MTTDPPRGFGRDLGVAADDLTAWFAQVGRSLPWRQPGSPGPAPHGWGVLVSEIMLQQTPVDRVLPMWNAWMERWPQPSDLAAAEPGEVIRAWGRLGYPRRALRLREAAIVITRDHDGLVPDDHDALLALPGIGDYTAGAVRAFAYGHSALALDTNVRRVIARHDFGVDRPGPSVTVSERERARALQPHDRGDAWMAALMELGALVCTSRNPACEECPVSAGCRWLAAGRPTSAPPRRQATYEGSDRQARGAILAVLRAADGPVTQHRLDLAWPDAIQRARALDSLVADGLVMPVGRQKWALPDR